MELLAWELRWPNAVLKDCNHSPPQDYSFDDINDMPLTTLLSVIKIVIRGSRMIAVPKYGIRPPQIAEW